MDIVANSGKDAVLELPKEVLSLSLAYEMANAGEGHPNWPSWLYEEMPELVESVLEKYWRVQIATKAERLTKFYAFNGDEPQLRFAAKILPGLLKDHPNLHPQLLESMLLNAIRFCKKNEIVPLVKSAVKKRYGKGTAQKTMWIATGFVIEPDEYIERLKAQLKKQGHEKWAAYPILIADVGRRGEDGRLTSSIRYRKLVVELLGSAFKNIDFKTGGEARWIGNRDEPTVANEIRNLIHIFGEDPSEDAAGALVDLVENTALSEWHTHIRYSMANQVRTAREARFTYPDVSQVVSTLSNAEPANVADLKAIIMDALIEVAGEIRHGNTDGYKAFWNTGDYGKATEKHVDENTARNRLLELLRPKIRHLDIAAEPEVLYADEKRADIAIFCRGMKLPIEIKRDDNKEIWKAAENQLKKQYSRDPASEGNGIYLAFWFDGKGMAKPPKGTKKPTNADELQKALQLTVPESSTGLIDVIIIDASVPEDKKASKKSIKKATKPKPNASGTKRRKKKSP